MRRRLFAACMGAESRGLCSCGKPGHKQGKGARTGQRPTSRAGVLWWKTIFSRRGGGCGVRASNNFFSSWWWLWRPGSPYSFSLQMQRRVTTKPNARGLLGRPHHCRGIDSGRALPTINNGPTARLLCTHPPPRSSSLAFQASTCPPRHT
jgi:hypothetical protein